MYASNKSSDDDVLEVVLGDNQFYILTCVIFYNIDIGAVVQ